MIISGGANIFPAEIEAAILEMPEVLDCAVFGAPHPEFGESVVAALQLKPGKTVNQKSIKSFLDGKIAKFKIPRIIEIHDELPREDSGKIFKQKLRAPHWDDVERAI
jgi:long-chain acyl-CoA synthetase